MRSGSPGRLLSRPHFRKHHRLLAFLTSTSFPPQSTLWSEETFSGAIGLRTFSVGLLLTSGARNSLLFPWATEVPRSLAFCLKTVTKELLSVSWHVGHRTPQLRPGAFQNRLSLRAHLRTVSCLLSLSRALSGPCRASLKRSCLKPVNGREQNPSFLGASILLTGTGPFCPNHLLESLLAHCP